MTEIVELTVGILEDRASVANLNQRLRAGTCALDWRGLTTASDEQLAALLDGLALDLNADALGLDTVPSALQAQVERALEPRGASRSPRKRKSKQRQTKDALPQPAPSVWTAPDDVAVPETEAPNETVAPPRSSRRPTPPPPRILEAPPPAELRRMLEDAIVRDLLGPAEGPDEEITERRVRDRYLVGLLAPRRQRIAIEELDELASEEGDTAEDPPPETTMPTVQTMFPSSIGISFCVSGASTRIRVTASWGWYRRVESASLQTDTGNSQLVWRRTPMQGTFDLDVAEARIEPRAPVPECPEVVVRGVARKLGEDVVVTLFLVNGQDEPDQLRDQAWLFQPKLRVEAHGGSLVRRPNNEPRAGLDQAVRAEAEAMAMLYRDRIEFAVGHGVGVHVDVTPGDPMRAEAIETAVVPTHEVLQQEPPSVVDRPALAGLVLDMKDLADTADGMFGAALGALPRAYREWIDAQRARAQRGEDRLADHAASATAALQRCDQMLGRIQDGIALLDADVQAADAFRFANRAMWLQRTRTILAEQTRRGKSPRLEDIDVPVNRSWRTFQIAFLLATLPGMTRLDHPDRTDPERAKADLLWFPTGGGKTEAYLGASAYVMALRRLQGDVEGRSGEYGVAVLMRYTLRVLTLQQFQRASALICACETIRREAAANGAAKWGTEPFRIGLWVGYRTTPNWTDDAAEALKQSKIPGPSWSALGSPAQLKTCPWCGSAIDPGRDIQVFTYPQGSGRTITYCGSKDGTCPFSRRQSPTEGIPIVVVDEEVYRRLPTLVIATVDKFAQMPWNGITQMLFGRIDGVCSRHGFRSPELDDANTHPPAADAPAARTTPASPLRPPDLIIQDELHLISGPLGTLTGLYETAVDRLSTWTVNGREVRPKVIASTATIRRAQEQVYALFHREVDVFPPNGLEAGDNFFSIERPASVLPGRRYLGICAPGRRLKAALIRVYVAALAAGQQIFEKYGSAADPWLTLVGYFNALRELAGMRRLVDDDVRARLRDADKRGLARRDKPVVEELTSRKGSTEIPALLDLMEVAFEPTREYRRRVLRESWKTVGARPLDVLLATNMISVGVDVKRLGLMVVAGQPKTTGEYIQATSRVGRSAPGLVLTVYNWARPRDLSHYESFEQYHSTFYRHVEALSLTPFSPRALDRGLSAVLVALVRLAESTFNKNEQAQDVRADHPLVIAAVDAIRMRAETITGSKATGQLVAEMLKRRLDVWVSQAQVPGGVRLAYRTRKDGATRGLLQRAGERPWDEFTCPNSLRDVEPTAALLLDESFEADVAQEIW